MGILRSNMECCECIDPMQPIDRRGTSIRWSMALISPSPRKIITRRRFLAAGALGAAGLALYSGEVSRHWLEITNIEIKLKDLPEAFEGVRIAQMSDIHLGEFTEEYFLRHAVETINGLRPDVVLLTGDFVTKGLRGVAFGAKQIEPCAEILSGIGCEQRFAVLGNHDVLVDPQGVMEALSSKAIKVLRNSFMPLERGGARIWLAGLDDVLEGDAEPELAIPAMIRNQKDEPIVLMCHEPDFVRWLVKRPEGEAVSLMLSGHTHGGQVRFPFVPPINLPPLGRHYVEGLFQVNKLQLYVNRGLGTVALPFRLNCPPEITLFTLRRG